ncbi:MAG: MerC domain-containing protein [bacterium]|nr:MerC domain-containing protein [bacterium]
MMHLIWRWLGRRIGRYILYVLGLVLAFGLIYWFSPWSVVVLVLIGLGATGYAVYRSYGWRRAGQTVAVGLMLVGGWLVYYSYFRSTPDGVPASKTGAGVSAAPTNLPPTIVVGREWSPTIRVLPGRQFLMERRQNAAYQIKIQTGRIYTTPRDPEGDARTACERQNWIGEAVSSFQIQVVDPVVEKVEFDIAFSRYTPGGPCGKVTPPPAPKPEPSTPPELPERPRTIPILPAKPNTVPA